MSESAATQSTDRENYLRAALLVLAAALMFAAMGALIKHLSTELPNEMVVFFRNLFGLLTLLPWLLRRGLAGLRTRCPRLHLLRTLFGLSAMYCYFYALGRLPLADAVLLNYAAPLYIPFIAGVWLAEPFPWSLRLGVVVGFAGIALILKPGDGMFQPAALVGLAAGLFTAAAFVTLRRMAPTEPAVRTVFYFGTLATLVSAVPLAWAWRTPDPAVWGALTLTGMLATTGQLLMTRAYAHAPASRVGPLTYSVVVFATLLGWAVWREVPDAWSLLGAGLVCLAGILALRPRWRPRPAD